MTDQQKWHKEQINKYAGERLVYQKFADILSRALNKACKLHASTGIVQARAKALPSFAEKALRKVHKYDDPVHQLTDLCGARVITNTRDETIRICEFVREYFVIDEPNSLDVRSRLREMEFGYRSVHYVVQLDGDKLLDFLTEGNDEPDNDIKNNIEAIGNRKAEIQVRTLLQHAWGDICHDRLHKTQIKVPARYRRELARIAALLENADNAFTDAVQGLDALTLNYGAYMSNKEIRDEINTLSAVFKYDQKNKRLAHQIAWLAITLEDWEKAIEITGPFKNSGNAALVHDYGLAMYKSGNIDEGRKYLQNAVEINRENPREYAEAYCDLGDSWMGADDDKVFQNYEAAFKAAPSDPRSLASFLECKVTHDKNIRFLQLMHPSLESAITICRERAMVGVYLPWAFFNMGKFHLMLGEPYKSLEAFAKAVQLSNSISPIKRALNSVNMLIKKVEGKPEQIKNGLVWIQRFLNLAIVAKILAIKERRAVNDKIEQQLTSAMDSIRALGSRGPEADRAPDFHQPVVIVAGGCDKAVEESMQSYGEYIQQAFKGFEGTIISGGTNAGISGLVGDLQTGTGKKLHKVGYLPYFTPPDVSPHPEYGIFRVEGTKGFSPLEPLQNWIDLLAAGIKPWEVRVLGINGGQIAAIEFRMALAFGAKVGIVESSGRAATELLQDMDWIGTENLLPLPMDSMTLKAFMNPGKPTLSDQQLENAGKVVHATYLKNNKHKVTDASCLPWEELREDFKESNRQQVAYAMEVLHQAGYGVRPIQGDNAGFPEFEAHEIETMAEMEHGRWNVERLKAGWKYGPTRDPNNKISPYLAPWHELPEEIKYYDRDAVKKFPLVLKEAGFEVYKK